MGFERCAVPIASPGGCRAEGGRGGSSAAEAGGQRRPRRRRRVTFGERGGDVTAKRVATDASGSRFDLVTPMGSAPVQLPLLGRFNVANALGVAGGAWGLGVPPGTMAGGRSTAAPAPGRL